MGKVVETQLDLLIRLQVVDTEIAGLQKKLDAIPRAVEKRRDTYLEAGRALEAAREELAEARKEHRQAEGKLDAHLDKIRKINEQTGMVKTNKEYQALLVEIENLKKEQDGCEERILELMEQAGDVERKIKVAEGEVAREKASFQREETRLLAEGERLKAELQRIEADREKLVRGVEKENIQTYNRVKAFRGDAVAQVENELCLGCRVTIPPQKYADVIMMTSIETCAHCQRILYYRRGEQVRKGVE